MVCALTGVSCFASPKGPVEAWDAGNHRPIIVKNRVLPSMEVSGGALEIFCRDRQLDQIFQLGVAIDYDVEQVLYVRWFVDYHEFDNFDPFEQFELEPDPEGGVERRSDFPVLIEDRDLTGFEERVDGFHNVEVRVSDGPPLRDADFPFKQYPPGASFDSYIWLINVDNVDCLQ